MEDFYALEAQLARLALLEEQHLSHTDPPTLPPTSALRAAEASLPFPSSAAAGEEEGKGDEKDKTYLAGLPAAEVAAHITRDIIPALNGQGRGSRYYGFVTGGVLPVAEWADNVVSHADQNVQVHLPEQTVATTVEHRALGMLADLLRLGDGWSGRTMTTGATGSNVLGLACGREAVLAWRLARAGAAPHESVGELGLLGACARAGITEIQVLTSAGHSSLSKAASVVGLGRRSVKELRRSGDEPWRLDLDAVERELRRPGTASIIALSCGEVNTGRYALRGKDEMTRLRALADEYGAWIHVDGAFGIFAGVLGDEPEFKLVKERSAGIELADSITVDGHKVLNVPYDCGMFFTRSLDTLQNVFMNPNAAYLSSGSGASSIPSPLNVGLENSRRFRALPVYAALLNQGREGFENLVRNMVRLSRRLAAYLRDSEHYELLPPPPPGSGDDGSVAVDLDEVFIIVLFRARDAALNERLVGAINETRQMYVSGTRWAGEAAVRIAVSNWKVNVDRDYRVVTGILEAVAEGRAFAIEDIEESS